MNRRPLGYEGISVLKVNRSEPRKAKLHQQFLMPPSDPSRFSLVAVHAQKPAHLEPQASRRPDGRLGVAPSVAAVVAPMGGPASSIALRGLLKVA